MTTKNFIHLNIHTAYSLSQGAIKIDRLIKLCIEHQMPAVAICDTANLFGVLDFSIKALANGIQPIIGTQINIEKFVKKSARNENQNQKPTSLRLYAKNATGYYNLMQLMSKSYLQSSNQLYPEVSFDNLRQHSNGIIALTGSGDGEFAEILSDENENCCTDLNFNDQKFNNQNRNNASFNHSNNSNENDYSDAYNLNTNNLNSDNPNDSKNSNNQNDINITTNSLDLQQFKSANDYINTLNAIFPNNLYIEISRHSLAQETKIEPLLLQFAHNKNIPIVATNNVCFPSIDYFEAHDVLTCIANTTTIYAQDRQTSSPHFYFKTQEQMCQLFADLPEAIENTTNIAKRCSFVLRAKKPKFPPAILDDNKYINPQNPNDDQYYIQKKAYLGLEERVEIFKTTLSKSEFEEKKAKYFQRLEYELEVINKMGFNGYFLIVSDYVEWAKKQNIPVGPGRGSGAGSIVAWSLLITDVDPIYYNLVFERFLNPDRVSMPDFDIDFCQLRRDEVIEYMQKRYGADSVAQIITFGKLQPRAVIKDVGRALAMPYSMADKISKMVPFIQTNPLTLSQAIDAEENLKNAIKEDPQIAKLIELALKLEGLYRHVSVHAAGIVVSDGPMIDVIPLYKDPKSHLPVTQFSMKFIEDASLVKFDFLGLKTLTLIQKVLDLIALRGIFLKSTQIPIDDKKTFQLLKEIKTVGVFQVESPGMMNVVKKLQPDKVEDLIAIVALYRPGPMDDIPRYIACKHGKEQITYVHEKLKPILSETYGVMVYQEQVMQMAQVIAGYTLGQADLLRRAMGKKDHLEMSEHRIKFINGAVKNGLPLSDAEFLFDLMSKFASYGFNKSHSTPYGLLTYQTGYLKANYTLEFFSILMLLDILNTDKLGIFVKDAKKFNIKILKPDINESYHEFLINYKQNSIRYSLTALKGSGEQIVKDIIDERSKNGKFVSIWDFVKRMKPYKAVNKRILESYIKAGCFDAIHLNRHQLFESIDIFLSIDDNQMQVSLFDADPELKEAKHWSDIEKLNAEKSAIGFFLSGHPLDQYEKSLEKQPLIKLKDLNRYECASVLVFISEIEYKYTKNGKKFAIMHISDPTADISVSVFSENLEKYASLIFVSNLVVLDVLCHFENNDLRVGVHYIDEWFDGKMYNKCANKRPGNANDEDIDSDDEKIIDDENFNNDENKNDVPKNDVPKVYNNNANKESQNLQNDNSYFHFIKIKLENQIEVQKLLEIIKTLPQGGTAIELHVTADDVEKIIILNSKYNISIYDFLQFQKIFGKEKVWH